MAVTINSAADARYYAARMNTLKSSSSTTTGNTLSSFVSEITKITSSLISTAKETVTKITSAATTTTKKTNTSAAVNAASTTVKSKTNQNNKTTTTISSAVQSAASNISKVVDTITSTITKNTQNTTTNSKNTTTSTNASGTKETTSSNNASNNDMASNFINAVATVAATVKKAQSNITAAIATERARQEAEARAKAEEQAALARAAAMSKSRPSAKANTPAAVNTAASNNTTKKSLAVASTNKITPIAASMSNTKVTIAPDVNKQNTTAQKISDTDRVNNAVSILAAKNAKIPVDSHGVPIINNDGDAKRYNMELNKLKTIDEQIKKASQKNITIKKNNISANYERNNIKSQFAYYEGDEACYATSADNMWRSNNDAIGTKIITLAEDYKNTGIITGAAQKSIKYMSSGGIYTGLVYTGKDENGNTYSAVRLKGLSKKDYDKLILNELNKNKIVCARVVYNPGDIPEDGHTMNIVGIDSNGDYLYENCGRSTNTLSNLKPETLPNSGYTNSSGKKRNYYELNDGQFELWIDTSKQENIVKKHYKPANELSNEYVELWIDTLK